MALAVTITPPQGGFREESESKQATQAVAYPAWLSQPLTESRALRHKCLAPWACHRVSVAHLLNLELELNSPYEV